MTCVVGLVHKGCIYIGADSAGTDTNFSIAIRKDKKVFHNGAFIMGFTTSFRMGQILQYKFKPPVQKVKSDFRYMTTEFIDGIKRTFVKNDFSDKNRPDGGTFIIGYNGNLYKVYGDFQVEKSEELYCAAGCGENLALGAMFASRGKTPEQRIRMALRAASKFNAAVAAPFHIVRQL